MKAGASLLLGFSSKVIVSITRVLVFSTQLVAKQANPIGQPGFLGAQGSGLFLPGSHHLGLFFWSRKGAMLSIVTDGFVPAPICAGIAPGPYASQQLRPAQLIASQGYSQA